MIERDRQILCIKNIFHDVQSITIPAVSGFVHAVYIVNTTDGKYICRFSNPETAKHNLNISKLLLAHDINIPDVSVHHFKDICCETYPFINGKTFYERILEGASDKEKDKIYNQLFDLISKIALISYDSKSVTSKENICAKVVAKLFDFINPCRDKVLAYADLNSKNVLLDQDDNVYALLDLDSVSLRNFSLGFISMMSWAKTNGYIPKGLTTRYAMTGTKSRISIEKQIQIYNYLVCFYIKHIRKHMLNFRHK